MTKQEAITKHREMWRWIAGIIEEKKCHVDISSLKEIFCSGQAIDIENLEEMEDV